MEKRVIGVDIGGTSMKYGLVTQQGTLLWKEKAFMENFTDGNSAIHALSDMIAGSLESTQTTIDGIGIGCAGSIDSEHGIIDYSNNLGWRNIPIREMMEDYFHMPVRISNDANAACLGESTFGAARGMKDVVLLTLGTGVGSGFVLDGKLYEGKEGKGAEFGHSVLVVNGRPCTCSRKGCVEAYCSATALIHRAKEEIQLHPDSLLAKAQPLDGKTIFDASRQGDEVARFVTDEFYFYLKEAVLNLINVFRPETILFSGGLSQEKENLTERLKSLLEKEHYGFGNGPKPDIRIAALGEDAGIIGAACLALS